MRRATLQIPSRVLIVNDRKPSPSLVNNCDLSVIGCHCDKLRLVLSHQNKSVSFVISTMGPFMIGFDSWGMIQCNPHSTIKCELQSVAIVNNLETNRTPINLVLIHVWMWVANYVSIPNDFSILDACLIMNDMCYQFRTTC